VKHFKNLNGKKLAETKPYKQLFDFLKNENDIKQSKEAPAVL
jgi:hypothetical protein